MECLNQVLLSHRRPVGIGHDQPMPSCTHSLTQRLIGLLVCVHLLPGAHVCQSLWKGIPQEKTLATFFNPDTYRKPIGMVFPSPPCTDWAHVQKRAADSPLPGAPQAKRMMGKAELLEKFKLAAELNGMSWDDLIAIWLSI